MIPQPGHWSKGEERMAGGDTYATTLADVARGMGIDPNAAIREAPIDAIRDDPVSHPIGSDTESSSRMLPVPASV
jgi:hypothetical protein